jgi:hypothetical protein
MRVRYALVADGPTDAVLVHVLDWCLRSTGVVTEVESQFIEPRFLPPLRDGLEKRLQTSAQRFPMDILFVHRDAEKERHETRAQEVHRACQTLDPSLRYVPVVPVRMTEAWLLFDEAAIRRAAGNPSGRVDLDLPSLKALERVPEPKQVLRTALLEACELRGRMKAKFNVAAAGYRVAELISDFGPLLILPAFSALHAEIAKTVHLLRVSKN